MKIKIKIFSVATSLLFFMFGFFGSNTVFAASTPSLGTATTFGVLAHKFSYAHSGWVVTGNIGDTTSSGSGTYLVSGGTTYVAPNSSYTQAGADQGTALAALSSQACTVNLPAHVDLASFNSGVYAPGVYCTPATSGATIGAGGITLNGSGTYIFRIAGALVTADHSVVTLSNGASACDIFWTTAPDVIVSVLGAYSNFSGTLIEPESITIKDHLSWSGRALVFNGNVSIDEKDSITVPSECTLPPPPPPPPPAPAILHIIKHVVNDNGGKEIAADFTLHVKGSGSMGLSEVVGSPVAGAESPGVSYTLDAGNYVVSENDSVGYTAMFSDDCNAAGHLTLNPGDNKTCTITNDDIAPKLSPPPEVPPIVVPTTTVTTTIPENPPYYPPPVFVPTTTVTTTITPTTTLAPTTTLPSVLPTSTPPTILPPQKPPVCDICSKLTYDVYIINPDKSERHTGTPWVRVTDRSSNVKRYSFEDKTLDPNDSNYDYNDAIVDVDFTDCKNVKFTFVSSDASWKHKIKIKVSIDGIKQSDTLITNDSKAVVGTSKTINTTVGVKVGQGCPSIASIRAICKRNAINVHNITIKTIQQSHATSLKQAKTDYLATLKITDKKDKVAVKAVLQAYNDAKKLIEQNYRNAAAKANADFKSNSAACNL